MVIAKSSNATKIFHCRMKGMIRVDIQATFGNIEFFFLAVALLGMTGVNHMSQITSCHIQIAV
jgi:hypothetical protein